MKAASLMLMLWAATANGAAVRSEANPIRKVVNLMKEMQHEIETEGAKEQELFDKFMCFCNGGSADLKKSISESTLKITELEAKLKQETAEKAQMAQDLVDHAKDRTEAKDELAEAATLRAKEESEYAGFAADAKANIAAIAGAVPALEKGMGGGASLLELPSSIPTSVVKRITQLAEASPSLSDLDRRHLTGFLQQQGDYAPAGGQIVGILKQMQDEMESNLKEAVSEEDTAVKAYAGLKASKEDAVKLASEAIESKTVRNGELAVSVVQTKDEIGDTQTELADAEKFAANLEAQCAAKQKEWDERCKLRSDEIAAIGEAISILNDDDSLEVFKKTLPSSALLSESVGFLQQKASEASSLRRAQALVARMAKQSASQPLKLLLFSLNSKIKIAENSGVQAGNFGKVIEIIDGMVGVLAKDQAADDKLKDWCASEFDTAEDQSKSLKNELDSLSANIRELGDEIMSLTEEVSALQESIKGLDKAVVVATEQRKDEHEEYVTMMQMTQTASALVEKAKNRLNKFYAPSLAPASFLQVSSLRQGLRVDPPQAPETFGDYKKSGKSAGVLALMDQIIKDLGSDMQEAEYEEKEAQKSYQELMQDSQASRKSDAQSITDKEGAKANLKSELDTTNENRANTQAEHDTLQQYINQLHGQCDFLTQNYGVRKEARATEREGLTQAKAMLSGAR